MFQLIIIKFTLKSIKNSIMNYKYNINFIRDTSKCIFVRQNKIETDELK